MWIIYFSNIFFQKIDYKVNLFIIWNLIITKIHKSESNAPLHKSVP